MFNPQIWAQGRAKAAWCIASLLCRRQQLPQAVAIPGSPCRPPQYPQAMCPSGTGASPWGANPSAAEPGARQQESGFASVVVCAELQTPFIQLLMMGAEAFACPPVPPSGKCNTYFFLKASSVSAKCTDKGKQKVSQSSPKCLCCNCCSPQGRGCVCGLGGVPRGWLPGCRPCRLR